MPNCDKFDFPYSTAMEAKRCLCVALEERLKLINEDFGKCDERAQAVISYETSLIYDILEKIENNVFLNPKAR